MSKKYKEQREDKSVHVQQRDKVKEELRIREYPWTPKQKQLIDLVLDKNTKMVFIKGPAGSSKSILAVYCALRLLNDKKISSVQYVRTAIESSSKSLGYLGGDKLLKMEPYLQPCMDKLEELLPSSQTNFLISDERIKGEVVNFLRGRGSKNELWIADESQNFTFSEMTTLITRLGEHSKMLVLADCKQSDIQKSGFAPIYDIFNDEESKARGIHTFEFNTCDILRSATVKYIVEKLEKYETEKNKGSMFPDRNSYQV